MRIFKKKKKKTNIIYTYYYYNFLYLHCNKAINFSILSILTS